MRFLIFLFYFILIIPSWANEVHVAVAANFAAPMKQISAGFLQTTGHKAELSFGATGKFYAQIKNGAPFDILLAADHATPTQLMQEHLAVKGSQFTYALGRLVLWSAKANFVDAQGAVLKQGSFAHIAMASPTQAPYGKAAKETLTALNLYTPRHSRCWNRNRWIFSSGKAGGGNIASYGNDEQRSQTEKDAIYIQCLEWRGVYTSLLPKIVQGESIGQTYSFVATGNAELGFVALSQVSENNQIKSGSAWIVPDNLYKPLRQDAVLLNHGKDNPAANALLSYLKSDVAKQIMRSYGYHFQ